MATTDHDPLAGKIPITLITGSLGAGKTTLVRHLLSHPDTGRAAVVINEIGEIGIDDDLVRASSESVSLMANGCLCCAVRTDLQETLRELIGDRRAGAIPDFDRVIVETTGLADPGPVIQTLITDSMLNARYRLDGVVTLVDAVNAFDQLASSPETERQIALADRIFITKKDLSDPASLASLTPMIRAINAQARIRFCNMGQIHPSDLTGIGLDSARVGERPQQFLRDLGFDPERDAEAEAEAPYLGHRLVGRHDPLVKTLSVRFEQPFSWPAFSAAMEMLIGLRGKDLLRVKGIVNVEGSPVVVQGVGHIFHDPVTLDRWPGADTTSRIVFIARGMDIGSLRGVFEAARNLGFGHAF
ncbi:CobW family GTP-binding protein [Pigmentiphaga kullae]|uniref:G3E family GTPase n=1 Tax=Pigmentiphaga kullae TaxID=151784 RepID=A0A4Q7NN74_9BURK|nr:GTP-binding protein [Pigmentiphaga kullae]RZS86665.1 G3E family GTPase [Pigmentiphaga kullae]